MLKAEPPNSNNNIYIYDENLVNPKEDEDSYIQRLKQTVFDELLLRIEKDMDPNAVEILDTARVKLQKILEGSKLTLIALKPICLLFLFEAYLEVQVNI